MTLFSPAVCLLDDNYYNEWDAYAAQWLRNLMARGLIAQGVVDERSIVDVQADDLKGYTQCHFFAGIGGWPLALRASGWADSRPVWTGSCPCQPFSAAGKQEGFDDPRHLWPQLKRLVEKRLPSVFFGEQVASASQWLRLVRGDLDAMGYAVGAIPVEAASAGADHLRDRYWFVADYDLQCPGEEREQRGRQLSRTSGDQENIAFTMEHTQGFGWGKGWTEHELRSRGITASVASVGSRQVIECTDGKWRQLPPPGVRWLGTGIPARVAKLRAFGNAIDWRPAGQVIQSYMEIAA